MMIKRTFYLPRWRDILTLIALVVLAFCNSLASAACNPYYGLGLIQSTHGVPGNFEVVSPASAGGMVHYWRDNSTTQWSIPWSAPSPFGSGDVNGVGLIQSNFTTNSVGHLEVVATVGSTLVTYWRDDGGTMAWDGPTVIGSGARGTPGFVQSRHGTKGNFEVVAPRAAGGLAHYWRNNDAAGLPWSTPTPFGNSSYVYDAVALMRSNYGLGNLEVIARTGSTLHHYWREDGTTWAWHGPTVVASGVQGAPGFIQSDHGVQGNFEVVTPKTGGGLVHYWRDNDQASQPWSGPDPLPGVTGSASAVSIIQSNYGPGHLEWVARVDGELYSGWRDDGASWAWNGPYAFSAQPCCNSSTHGAWSDAISAGMVGIHAALLRTSNVLFFGFTDASDHSGISRVLNPNTGALTSPTFTTTSPTFTTPSHPNAFCAGQAALPDGRILVSGGHHGDNAKTHIFDPGSNSWSFAGMMSDGRWYPTTTTLANGNVFIISGSNNGGGPIRDDPD